MSQQKTVAVMDLGTNTFHLLIAQGTAAAYNEIVHKSLPAKLGEGGINKGVIIPAAFERGMAAMQQYEQDIAKNSVDSIKAVATSALRNAANGQEFIDKVRVLTGIDIELINGEQEATYIYKGVKLAGSLGAQTSLIMDIGGGSVEFILCNADEIFWKQSFEIGAARLMDKFHQVDPIPASSIAELHFYLEEKLAPLFKAAKQYKVESIIGSSGAFETFAEIIELDKRNPFDLKNIKNYPFETSELIAVTDKLIASSHQQRKSMEGIVSIRVDMIVVASLLTRFVMDTLKVATIKLCTNSLKEGILADML
ncbi:exopolyphosphatase [Mucilaginibacter calamicampi]|uniref:Exopolyphosphatase n=1 Tax=Mucilaginibacter calamicampi TaxID=1302352 RepID=A0ABW2YX40_9SPHI